MSIVEAPIERQTETPGPPATARPVKKKVARRTTRDRSQALRSAVQIAFLLLNVWIGVQFYLFVRYYETQGASVRVNRPPGVEGWLPVAGLMNLKDLLLTGQWPAIHAAGLFLLLGFLAISFVFRKTFCSWLCPVGTISEALWRAGKKIFKRNFHFPGKLDIALRSLKYLLLGLFVYAVVQMSVEGIREFLNGPYGVIADVKMLNFFRYMGIAGFSVLAALVVASLFVQNFWCRYLCPYGALMGLPALLSPLGIRRDTRTCIDCAKCAKACPSLLPVDKLVTVRSAECTACMECVAVCPVEGALQLATLVPARRRVPAWVLAAGIAGIFFTTVLVAHLTGHWHSQIADDLYFYLIPRANEFSHP